MIEIKNLYKSFGSKKVLDGVDAIIDDGKSTCIIGKSGCGKSVLLKHIVGLLKPDAGSVKVDGKEIATLKKKELFALRETMGFVFQGAALFDSLSVYENVIISPWEKGFRNSIALEKEAQTVLSAVGLLPEISEIETQNFIKEWQILKNKKPSELSGGMKKRVGVARALVGSPRYIFYDEPTTGLDPVTSEQIDDLIMDLSTKIKSTSIIITHDMFSVFKIAHSVIMLNQGKAVFSGPPEELRKCDNEIVREFLKRYD